MFWADLLGAATSSILAWVGVDDLSAINSHKAEADFVCLMALILPYFYFTLTLVCCEIISIYILYLKHVDTIFPLSAGAQSGVPHHVGQEERQREPPQ